MGIVRDVTIDQLTQAVQGISSTGISDSTGQAINNTLNTLGKDTSLQGIISAINALGTLLGSDKANISGDNIADKETFRSNIEAEPRTIYDTFNVTFSGTVTPSTPLKDTQTSVAKSGYKIISITPQLTVADSNIILTPLVFGGQDNQIITTCQISTGSRVNPTCTLHVLYRKSSY